LRRNFSQPLTEEIFLLRSRPISTGRFIAAAIGRLHSRPMLSLANDLVTRAARLIFAAQGEPALWTISAQGRIQGSLVCEAGTWRLSWFDGADSRLASHAGSPSSDVEALAEALSARLGAPVRLESLAV
jgi:hypothetical protein